MPISVVCAGCRTKFLMPDEAAGKRGKCRRCGAVVQVPSRGAAAPVAVAAVASAGRGRGVGAALVGASTRIKPVAVPAAHQPPPDLPPAVRRAAPLDSPPPPADQTGADDDLPVLSLATTTPEGFGSLSVLLLRHRQVAAAVLLKFVAAGLLFFMGIALIQGRRSATGALHVETALVYAALGGGIMYGRYWGWRWAVIVNAVSIGFGLLNAAAAHVVPVQAVGFVIEVGLQGAVVYLLVRNRHLFPKPAKAEFQSRRDRFLWGGAATATGDMTPAEKLPRLIATTVVAFVLGGIYAVTSVVAGLESLSQVK